jgi:4-methylaminobutanoate oxidase (formaldehyde-forming)
MQRCLPFDQTLERKQLTSGTTWAAAGLIGQLRASREMTNLAKYGTELYAHLEEETGQATGYQTTGALGVAQTEDRKREWLRGASMARAFGIEMYEISLSEAQDLVPLLNTDGLVSVFYLPQDGQTNPVDTAQALAKGARMGGARIIEGVKVLDIHVKNGAVSGVNTDKGDIACEYVVNCGGMWGREIGKMVGVSIPLHAAEHMHMVTKPIWGIKKLMPTVRDFDGHVYFREEGGGLLMGGFEPVAKPWGMKGIPEDFMFTELQEDWGQFEIFMESGLRRFPCLETAEVRHLSVVPESFTPDNAYMLGEAPGVKNFFVACGMNSVGIASAGGAGKALAQWIDQGYPEEDLWSVDIRRFFGWQQNSRYLHDRTVETVGLLYAHHYPYLQRTTARSVLCSPFHDRLAERGACFGMVAGWERANWFAPEGVKPEYQYGWGRQKWFEFSAQEHMAVREGVGVYDLTSMHKYLFQGRDVEAVLQHICSNDMAIPIGKIVYTQLLNERGGIEADVTVTRLAEETYFIITSVAAGVRDFDWINRHIPESTRAILTDVTHGYAMLAVMGPKSRDLLQTLTEADLSNEGFPFGTAQQIDIAYARPWVLRFSYVGELGWELYIPTAFATGVFDALTAEGAKIGLRLVGLHAVDSLRLEKGYRHWGSDITPDDTPFEAGLGFGVKFDKGDFIGRDTLLQQKESGLTRKLVIFTLEEPNPLLYHDEPIYRDGELVSLITHGAYAHLLKCSMGMGYLVNPEGVDDHWILSGRYEIDVEGKRIPAKAHLNAPYDPRGERVRM